jgi:flagellar motility protein MotE (MotC chaperone)
MQAHSSILMMSEERDQPTIFSDTACEKAATLTRLMASPLNTQNEDSLLFTRMHMAHDMPTQTHEHDAHTAPPNLQTHSAVDACFQVVY